MSLFAGVKIIFSVYALTATLYSFVPGRIVAGYACDCSTGKPLQYKLNGLAVLFSVVFLWLTLGFLKLMPFGYLAQNFYSALFVANLVGLVGSAYLYVRGKSIPLNKRESYMRCPTKDRPEVKIVTKAESEADLGRSVPATFFLGQEFNPRLNDFDLKMFLYLVGAIMLFLNVYSAAVLQYQVTGHFTNSTIVYSFLFTHFVTEYLFFEEVHLYTYDLFAEKLGFKLFWGCTVFYPFFYAIGSRYLISSSVSVSDLSGVQAFLTIAFFYFGWFLTRGSNLQKFALKTNPKQKTFTLFGLFDIEQETIANNRLLVSGFWAVARHVNYLGETLQSIALSIPCVVASGSFVPMLYPIYYIGLFVSREIDDDKICAEKYGKDWEEYKRRVPYRIVPFVW